MFSCPHHLTALLLKKGIQQLIDNQEILFEKAPISPVLVKEVSIITIYANPSRAPKICVRITPVPKTAPLKITMPGPTPYNSDKTVPWNYGGEIYYHGIKQNEMTAEEESSEEDNSDISNIVGTSKITHSDRIFSPEITPPKVIFRPVAAPKVTSTPIIIPASTPINEEDRTPVVIPTNTSVVDVWGKGIQEESVRTKAQPLTIPETSKMEMEEILRIIKKSNYDMVEQLGQTPSKISMLELLLYSEAHAKSLVKFLKTAHVP